LAGDPTAIALASDYAQPRRRELTAAAVTVAIIFGGTLGGVIAVPLLRTFGWQGIFVLDGVVPILFAGLMALWLPDTVRYALTRRPNAASTKRLRRVLRLRDDETVVGDNARPPSASPLALFAAGLAVPTVLLWAMMFLSFMQSCTFTYWLPLFLTSFGFDRASAALGNTYIGTGSIAGVLLMIACVPRLGSARYLAIAFTIGAGFILLLGFRGLANGTVPYLLFLIGAGLGAGGVGQSSIGAKLYPAAARTTGIGMSSALGRIGSILGPTIAGVFLYLHWPERSIIATAAVLALAAACAAGIFVMIRHRPAESTGVGND
jgi:AAHS family 4-hydroxybenzoate transporter-like MFS transporter